jgi:methylenetetrahydrofolate--tRNA-(uracil-5-)-methyltransferase
MMGALFHYITRATPLRTGAGSPAHGFQPMKANFGLLPDLDPPVHDKRSRYAAYAARALADLDVVLATDW